MTPSARAKRLRIAVGFSVTLTACVWLYAATDWSIVAIQLRQLHRWDAAAYGTGAFLIQILGRAVRWRCLFPLEAARKRPTLGTLFDGIMAGNLGNYLLPLRAGELIRPLLVARETGYGYVTCLVSTIVERFFDLFVVLTSFGLILLTNDGLPRWMYQGGHVLALVAVAILLLIGISAGIPARLSSLAEFVLQRLPDFSAKSQLRSFVADFLVGTSVLRDVRRLMAVLILSLLIWLATFWQYQLFLVCCNLPASFAFATTITVMIAIAIAAPSSPGFIGIYQVACVAAFALFGQPKEVAVTYAIVSHSIQYLVVCGYGVVLLARYGLGDVTKLRLARRHRCL